MAYDDLKSTISRGAILYWYSMHMTPFSNDSFQVCNRHLGWVSGIDRIFMSEKEWGHTCHARSDGVDRHATTARDE